MKRLLILFVGGVLLLSGAIRYFAPKPPVEAAPSKPRSSSRVQTERLAPVIFENQESKTQAETGSQLGQAATNISSAAKKAAAATGTKGSKTPVRDPIARVALSEVGFSPEAEEYWLMAINDPTLSDSERQDLIEDLNEEGFEDPKNLTDEDLPLILSRIEIIEEYAPFAMDDVNAAAFVEAYKDLLTMFVKVTGR